MPEVLRPYMGGIDFLPFVRETKLPSKAEIAQKKQAAAKSGKQEKADKPPAAPKEQKPAKQAAKPPAAPAAGADAIVQQINAKVCSTRCKDDAVKTKVDTQGDEIRDLKKNKADKDTIMKHVGELNELKAKYEQETGTPFVSPNQQGSSKKKDKGAKKEEKKPQQQPSKKEKKAAAQPKEQQPKPQGKSGAASRPKQQQQPKQQAPAAKASTTNAPLNLDRLNEALALQSYVSGFVPTKDDKAAFDALASVMTVTSFAPQHANAKRWFTHIASFTPNERAQWGGQQTVNVDGLKLTPLPVAGDVPPPPKKSTPAPAKKAAAADDDDDMDLFGDDDGEEEEEQAPVKSRAEKARELKAQRDAEAEARKKAAAERLAKKEKNQRSLCNLEIKPWEAEQVIVTRILFCSIVIVLRRISTISSSDSQRLSYEMGSSGASHVPSRMLRLESRRSSLLLSSHR